MDGNDEIVVSCPDCGADATPTQSFVGHWFGRIRQAAQAVWAEISDGYPSFSPTFAPKKHVEPPNVSYGLDLFYMHGNAADAYACFEEVIRYEQSRKNWRAVIEAMYHLGTCLVTSIQSENSQVLVKQLVSHLDALCNTMNAIVSREMLTSTISWAQASVVSGLYRSLEGKTFMTCGCTMAAVREYASALVEFQSAVCIAQSIEQVNSSRVGTPHYEMSAQWMVHVGWCNMRLSQLKDSPELRSQALQAFSEACESLLDLDHAGTSNHERTESWLDLTAGYRELGNNQQAELCMRQLRNILDRQDMRSSPFWRDYLDLCKAHSA